MSQTTPATTRCKYCGVKMAQNTLADGTAVMQCPTCRYTLPTPPVEDSGPETE